MSKLPDGHMELADGWLVLNERGSNVKKVGLTPAEVLFLNRSRSHHKDDKEPKVIHLHNVRSIERSNVEEKERLNGLYGERDRDGNSILEKVIPGDAPNIPMTFAAAKVSVTNTTPPVQERKLHYPDLKMIEAEEKLEAARATKGLNDDVEALRELVTLQGEKLTQQAETVDKLIAALAKK